MASSEYGVINTMLKGLDKGLDVSVIDPMGIISGSVAYDLASELLGAFRKKCEKLGVL